jgi:hypothetical protein
MMRLVTDRSAPTRSRPVENASGEELEALWLAALTGDLTAEERERLDRRMAREPELRRAFERWQRAWSKVEDPPEVRLPLEFGARLARQAAREPRGRDGWRTAPAWVRWASAAALVCGIAAGVELSGRRSIPFTASSASLPETTIAAESASGLEDWVDGELLEASTPSLWEGLASGELTDAERSEETGSS